MSFLITPNLTLYFLLFICLVLLRDVSSFMVQNTLSDKIDAGEVRFYTVESKDPVVIALISDSGDADMYASPTNRNSHPSPENYDHVSASCGLDVIVLGMSRELSKITVGVYGHVRYDETSYRLYVISPTDEDIKRYQIWDWEPDSNSLRLSLDVDLFQFSYDHTLHSLIDDLMMGGVGVGVSGVGLKSELWTFDTLVKILELTIWDWDPESNTDKLLIDIDPLFFANDPTLNDLLEHLTQGGVAGIYGATGEEGVFETFIHWTGVVVVKLIEIALEILV